jgi:hypothetical protein
MPRHFQPARVKAKLVQHRRVDVYHIMTILHGVKTQLVRAAVDDAALGPSTGQPRREAVDVMVAAAQCPRIRLVGRGIVGLS